MTTGGDFEIFLVAAPGHEITLAEEAREKRFVAPHVVEGGVAVRGGWPEVWRANLELRGAGRVLARIGAFRALHLAQLDKRARRIAWADLLRPGTPFRVEATCRKSRIYHSGAAAQRVERAIADALGSAPSADAEIAIRVRLDDDLCTLAIDTSGEALYKRGFKAAVAKAPMRETLAAMFLRQCGFDGREPVLDPMCGSGTFVVEAAEISAGLAPGRARRFAFESLATFDPPAWQALGARAGPAAAVTAATRFHGSDHDPGAIRMSRANAERAGVSDLTDFRELTADAITPPDGPPGLVVVNPPYGARIGEAADLARHHRALGRALRERFHGWRVGLVTSEPSLAAATGLPWTAPSAPVSHGGLRVTLWQTARLP